MFKVDIFGELHTDEERARIVTELLARHKVEKYDFLLSEECGNVKAITKEKKLYAINRKMYSIGPQSYNLGLQLDLPVIGIDDWSAAVDWDNISTKEAFAIREKRMLEVITEYMKKGKCVVILGDTHLRTIKTKELGDPSVVTKTLKNFNNVEIIRSPIGEIK